MTYYNSSMTDAELARAIAYFHACPDANLLRDVLKHIQPKAAAAVRQAQMKRRDIAAPADIPAAPEAATRDEALLAVRLTQDFGQLQTLARAVGRRIEELNETAPPV